MKYNFSHGGDVYSFSKEFNLKANKIIDFSSNINFLKPPFHFQLDKINYSNYPDWRYNELIQSISKKYNIGVELIQLYNGATDAIFNILRHFNTLTIYAPIYLEYKKAKNFKIINRLENILEKPEKDSLAVFVNPTTPDGRYYELEELFEIWQKNNNTILIDESFLEFCNCKSALRYINKIEKLVVLKSFTKFYSCGGVRVASVFSKLKFEKPLWNISAFDEFYIKKALLNKKFISKTLKLVTKNKEYLYNILEKSSLFDEIIKSSTNFALAHLKDMTAQDLQRKLTKFNILIRNCSNFDFLDDKYVRFAVKSKKDLEKLKKALNE